MVGAPASADAPRSVSGVVGRGLRLWAENALSVWRVLLPIALVAELIGVLATVSAAPPGSFAQNGVIYVLPGYSTAALNTAHIVAEVLLAVGSLIGVGASLRIFGEAIQGRSQSPSGAFRFGLRRFGAVLWLSVLLGILILAGAVVLVLPGIYLLVALVVALPVMVIEGPRGGAALKRSLALVKGRWWATLGALLPSLILNAVVVVLGVINLRVTGSVTSLTLNQALFGLIAQVLIVPISTATSVAIYADLVARKGGPVDLAPPQSLAASDALPAVDELPSPSLGDSPSAEARDGWW